MSLKDKISFDIRERKRIRISSKLALSLGYNSIDKYIREFKSISYLHGVLYGYVLCDSEINIIGNKLVVVLSSKSKRLLKQLQTLLLVLYKLPSTFTTKRHGGKSKYRNNFYHFLNFDTRTALEFLRSFEWKGRKKSIVKNILDIYSKKNVFTDYKFKLPLKRGDAYIRGLSSRKSNTRNLSSSLRRTANLGFIQENNLRNWIKKYPIIKSKFKNYICIFDDWYCLEIDSIVNNNKKIFVYDISVPFYHNYILSNGLLSSNSSKSYSSLAIAGFLDETFDACKIYFDLDVLVNSRNKLRSNDCIIVDEMARVFGTDSMRISIQLNTMKEQLRKKSIHMIYVSPILKEEYHTSMYILETMFLDKVNKLSYNAFKTNQLLCLGYVAIPHPLHFIDKSVLIAYEKKKDEHLKEVLEGPADMIEERAVAITKNPYFMKAEEIYLKARGYIPYKILVQIIEKIYPEFKGSVIVYELADRCKANSEISGRWFIFGGNKGKE
jgi:hypothetical protein